MCLAEESVAMRRTDRETFAVVRRILSLVLALGSTMFFSCTSEQGESEPQATPSSDTIEQPAKALPEQPAEDVPQPRDENVPAPPKENDPAPLVDDLRADVRFKLQKDSWTQSEAITGELSVRFYWPSDSPNAAKTEVRMNGPVVHLVFQPGPRPATIYRTALRPSIESPVRVAQLYKVRAQVELAETFRGLTTGAKPLPIFRPGKYRVKARVESPFSWNAAGMGVETRRRFESDWVALEVVSSADAVPSAERLERALEKADPVKKAELTDYYQWHGFDLSALEFFSPAAESATLRTHEAEPFFVSAKAEEKWVFTCELRELHNFHLPFFNVAVMPNNPELRVKAPREEGLYKAECDIHHKVWGWLLVSGTEEDGASNKE